MNRRKLSMVAMLSLSLILLACNEMSNSPSNVDDDLTMVTFTEAFGIEPCEIGQIHNEVLLAGRDKALELIKDNRTISSEDLERETLKAEMNYFVGLVNEKGRVKYHFDENKYDLLFSDNQQFVSLLDGEFEYEDILSSIEDNSLVSSKEKDLLCELKEILANKDQENIESDLKSLYEKMMNTEWDEHEYIAQMLISVAYSSCVLENSGQMDDYIAAVDKLRGSRKEGVREVAMSKAVFEADLTGAAFGVLSGFYEVSGQVLYVAWTAVLVPEAVAAAYIYGMTAGAILGTITNSTIAYNKERANAAPTTGG